MILTPKILDNGNGYGVAFRHPLQNGKSIRRGLGTTDETMAKAICNDAVALFTLPDISQEKPSPKFMAYDRRAVEIVFGEQFAAEVFADGDSKTAFSRSDISDINDLRERTESIAKLDRREVGVELSADEKMDYFARSLKDFTPEAYRALQERNKELEKLVKALQPENEQWKEENRRLRAEKNVTIKATIEQAVAEWKPDYKEGRTEQTYNEGISFVESFVKSLPKKGQTKLRDVTDLEIDRWVNNLKSENGYPLSPITKRNRRNAVSVLMRWATKRFRLHENPMDKVADIPGVSRIPENILAIKRIADLRDFLNALTPHPYWHTWSAVACLAGPRFREQCYLKIADIYLDEDGDEIHVTSRTSGRHVVGTKTGKIRRIPIEKTILLPILHQHIKRRKAEQSKANANENERSEWLFPSIVEAGTIAREKTPPGLWSHNRTFLSSWQTIAEQLGAVTETDAEGKETTRWLADYWQYGPAEWRHTFGTALGMTGWTDLEIARTMGNSPRVCERYYVAKSSTGKRWPLQW